MPETPRSTTHTYQPDGPLRDRSGGPAESPAGPADLKSRLLRLALLPTAATTVLGAGVAVFLSRADAASGPAWMPAVVVGTGAVFLAMVAYLAVHSAVKIDADIGRQVTAVRRSTVETHYKIWQALEDLQRTLPPEQRWSIPMPSEARAGTTTAESLHLLAAEAHQLRQVAGALATRGVPKPAAAVPTGHTGAIDTVAVHPRVGIFVNLARRLQSLVHREIEQLDELENQVEDPDLLKGLFSVDHLATRIRRHAENLAVLGGATSHRQWSRPVNVYEALRSAVAEVEQYARVKLVRPIDGTLKGHAVADVIHLVAELVENATTFSAPQTQVLLRVQRVRAGLAIEVEDRGLGMEQHERDRYNMMLSSPDDVDLDELLADGRIGLYVVSSLARRHNLTVQLQSNIFGGTQAITVLGEDLLGEAPERPASQEAPAAPVPQQMPVRVPSPPPGSLPALPSVQLAGVAADTGRHSRPQPMAGTGHPAGPPAQPRVNNGYAPPPPPYAAPASAGYETAEMPALNGSGHVRSPEGDSRPALPKRNKQTHLAPQLREAPQQIARGSESGHDPGLMKAFQQGQYRADATDEPPIPSSDSSLTPYRNEEA
ncbi:sensor histidine kinase [Glycomyces arizonensis]|uniref:sensor histidine kinase n=1 Tax=Glycomyces arizonensis TaxID=256035 RepID=UPI0004120417|nr:ATP-binding protein [Glycomyces arizonensis]